MVEWQSHSTILFTIILAFWLGVEDSNLGIQIQSLLSYH